MAKQVQRAIGWVDNAVLVSRCGLPDEEIINDLQAQKDKKLNYLSIVSLSAVAGITLMISLPSTKG